MSVYDLWNAAGGNNMVGNIANVYFNKQAQDQRAREFDAEQQQLSIDNAYRDRAFAEGQKVNDANIRQADDDFKLREEVMRANLKNDTYRLDIADRQQKDNARYQQGLLANDAKRVAIAGRAQTEVETQGKFNRSQEESAKAEKAYTKAVGDLTWHMKTRGVISEDGTIYNWSKLLEDSQGRSLAKNVIDLASTDPEYRARVAKELGVQPDADGKVPKFSVEEVADENGRPTGRLKVVTFKGKEIVYTGVEVPAAEVVEDTFNFMLPRSQFRSAAEAVAASGGSTLEKSAVLRANADKLSNTLQPDGSVIPSPMYKENPAVLGSAAGKNLWALNNGVSLDNAVKAVTSTKSATPTALAETGSEEQMAALMDAATKVNEEEMEDRWRRIGGSDSAIVRSYRRATGQAIPVWSSAEEADDDARMTVNSSPEFAKTVLQDPDAPDKWEDMSRDQKRTVLGALAALRSKTMQEYTGAKGVLLGEFADIFGGQGIGKLPDEQLKLLGVKGIRSFNNYPSIDAAAR